MLCIENLRERVLVGNLGFLALSLMGKMGQCAGTVRKSALSTGPA